MTQKSHDQIEEHLKRARALVSAAYTADLGSVNAEGQRVAMLETARRDVRDALTAIDDAIDVLRNV